MPSRPQPSFSDRNAYIPPEVQHVMDRQMQQMPENLKRYVGSTGYVPEHIEAKINKQLGKNMPSYMKQYTGAYLQKSVIKPTFSRSNFAVTNPSSQSLPPPVPDQLRRSHSMPMGEQHKVELDTLPLAARTSMFESDTNTQAESPQSQNTYPTQPSAPMPSGDSSPAPMPPNADPYDFIVGHNQAAKQPLSLPKLPGTNSLLTKLLMALGAFILLIIVVSVGKSLFSGPTNVPALTTVAQDQIELMHIATNAAQEPDISSDNTTFIATLQLSVTSSNSQLINYMSVNGHKVGQKELNLKISNTTDQDLTTAETAGTYNQTFDQIATTQINTYLSDLNSAYNLTKGPKGRALLTSDFNQAKLLLTQINALEQNQS
jgi:hypothetical protein